MLPANRALELAKQIAKTPGIAIRGGDGLRRTPAAGQRRHEKSTKIRHAIAEVGGNKAIAGTERLRCPIVSCGGTGSYMVTLDCPGITELQAGGVIFMDVFYREKCQVQEFDFAL